MRLSFGAPRRLERAGALRTLQRARAVAGRAHDVRGEHAFFAIVSASGRLGRSDTLSPLATFRRKRQGSGKGWKVSGRGSLDKGAHQGGATGRRRSRRSSRGIAGDQCPLPVACIRLTRSDKLTVPAPVFR